MFNIRLDFKPWYVKLNSDPIPGMEHLVHRRPATTKTSTDSNAASSAPPATNLKRAHANGSNSDDEDSKKAKKIDIYKQRQVKKFLTK